MIDHILQEDLYSRDNELQRILDLLNIPVIKILTGMRRVGKSTLVKLLIQHVIREKTYTPENIYYLNKEYPSFRNILTADDLYSHFSQWHHDKINQQCLICIDEVQQIKDRQEIINGLHAQYHHSLQIIITGSNSTMLSGQLATLLTGRVMQKHILPLSYTQRHHTKNIKQAMNTFIQYLHVGGLPGTLAFGDNTSGVMNYLRDVYQSILTKDILSIHPIRNTHLLDDIYRFVFGNTGNIVSLNSIKNTLKQRTTKVHIDTLMTYLTYAQESYLLQKVHSVNPQTKKRFEIYNKWYAIDHGMRNALAGRDTTNHIGNVLENYVYITLIRAGRSVTIGRLTNGHEIDFIVEKEQKRLLIQVTYLLHSEDTKTREYRPLLEINEGSPKYVISMDPVQLPPHHSIQHIQARNWEQTLSNIG